MPKKTPGESKKGKRKARPIDDQSELLKKEDNAAMARCVQFSQQCFTPENNGNSIIYKRLYDHDTTQSSVDRIEVNRISDDTSSSTETTLLYTGSDVILLGSQQSSVHSSRTTGGKETLCNRTCLPFGHNLLQDKPYPSIPDETGHFSKEFTRQFSSDLPDRDNLSIWFYNVVDIIGINEKLRMACHEAALMLEIILAAISSSNNVLYMTGSSIEGTFASDAEHDYDVIQYNSCRPAFESLEEPVLNRVSFLIIRELTTPPGYVKLQLKLNGESSDSKDMLDEMSIILNRCKIDKSGRTVLCDIIDMPDEMPFMYRKQNKPAFKMKTDNVSVDNTIAFRCRKWPSFAQEWISRIRVSAWPTKNMVHKLSKLGFFVVKKGHPLSPEKELEWRISFSLQERELMFSLTDVQHKCYTVLKMFNREIIESKCITSYHWKTCLFYVIEQYDETFWEKKLLFSCIILCMKKMLKWITRDFCPNYFIPQENLFDGNLNKSQKLQLEQKLNDIIDSEFECLMNIKASNICEYYKSRGSLEDSQRLQADSQNDFKAAMHQIWREKAGLGLSTFNNRILNYNLLHVKADLGTFIWFLWEMLKILQNTETITEHTKEETKTAISSFIPHIHTCLASLISAIAIQSTNVKVRYFLLLGSFIHFMKGTLSGQLKFISVLYAIGLYKECEYYIDQQDEEYIKYLPSFCSCSSTEYEVLTHDEYMSNTTPTIVSTCVYFLSSELSITPDALKYEMFRYFGISVTGLEKSRKECQWHYRAVVDCNVYFFFLKALIKTKNGKIQEGGYSVSKISELLLEQQVRHRDVAYNLLAWVFADLWTPMALTCLTLSWNVMNSLDLCKFIKTEERKRRQYQFNAAKLHALVVVYKTWFAKTSISFEFCFQCFIGGKGDFKRCSKCKISKYCSKQCQKNNWTFHRAVCKIVRRYHNI